MKPQGEGAMQMAKVTGFVQRNPHDGAKVTEETAAYLGYDQKNLYVVFICFDDPKKVRARMSRREDIYDDEKCWLDHIRSNTRPAGRRRSQ